MADPLQDAAPRAPAREILTRKTLAYLVAEHTTRWFYVAYFRRKVEGLEHLPRSGGVVVASNHQSFLDIPLISSAIPRHVAFVARDTLARSRPLAWLMRECGAVLVARGQGDRAALREMVAHLQQGDCLSIFPEGTRTPDGSMLPFRAGALMVARMAAVPIVPAAIWGTFDAWPRQHGLPRPKRIGIRFGAPVDSAAPDALERVRASIEDLLTGRAPAGGSASLLAARVEASSVPSPSPSNPS